MINHYRVLTQRIRKECDELERIVGITERHMRAAVTAADRDAYLNSVALNLHGWYSGVERLFELIATNIDGVRLGGERWHAELLHQMELNLPEVRPPVLSAETIARLENYRKFRHLIRNVYTTSLDAAELDKLVKGLRDLWKSIRGELETFCLYLDGLAHADDPESDTKS